MDLHMLAELLPHLGIDAERALAWLALVMTVLAAVGWALDAVLPRLRAHAKSTKTTVDDDVVTWLEKLTDVLHLINAIVPRPRFGAGREPDEGEEEEE